MEASLREQLEILRRIAERGWMFATSGHERELYISRNVDLWQHMLDEIERTNKHLEVD